jgi:hypothetical protein
VKIVKVMTLTILNRTRAIVRSLFNRMNSSFNSLPKCEKLAFVLALGICVTGISATLVIQALRDQESEIHFNPDRVIMPYDIYMNRDEGISESQLVPVGKMKGEIDGEFESFYVAVDNKGAIYINRDIEYSERAYDKSDDWKQISREKLAEYERDLHFIPLRSRGIKR